jgi:hypothetical protein
MFDPDVVTLGVFEAFATSFLVSSFFNMGWEVIWLMLDNKGGFSWINSKEYRDGCQGDIWEA